MHPPPTEPATRAGPTDRTHDDDPAKAEDEGSEGETRDANVADDADGLDAEAAREAIRARGESVRRDELRRAFARLEAHGELTQAQRRAVAAMASAIVDGVLAAPVSTLTGEDAPRREAARTAVELFDSEP